MTKAIEINPDKLLKKMKVRENAQDLISDKKLEIKGAALRDQMCNYSYELLDGKTKGDIISRKGVHVVHDDMLQKFEDLNVFLAHIDGAFKDANNQTPLSELEAEDLLNLYSVSGFKITGVEENKSVILVGHKQVTYGSISFETPKIKLEGATYLYIEELTQRIYAAISEVEQYMDGKLAPQFEQSVMTFEEEDNMDLAGAKVGTDEEEEE
jgi:hypothetical protein